MTKKKIDFKPTLTDGAQRKKLASNTMKNAFRIGKKIIAWVPVELLNIQEYQRNRQRHVTQIAENWDDSKCNVLLVSYNEEDGCFNIMDGQHRGAAARMRGVEYLVCEIFINMTTSKEASMFVDANVSTKKLNPFDTYKANQFISAEDETELSRLDKRIAVVCKKYNVSVDKANAAGTLKSVPVARSIIKRDGEKGLEFVFAVIQESHWDNFKDGYGSDLMTALEKIYIAHKAETKTIKKRLCEFFVKSTPNELEALGNNNYPNFTRRARLDAVLADIIKETKKTSKTNDKVTNIA